MHVVVGNGREIQAWLFDLDGVLTDTARVHAAAWKDTFDEVVKRRAAGEPYRSFDLVDDYERYVDGKPRSDGVRDFLASRGITLADGSRSDPPEHARLCAVWVIERTRSCWSAWLGT